MRVTLCRLQEVQMDCALAAHAVQKLRRGPTCGDPDNRHLSRFLIRRESPLKSLWFEIASNNNNAWAAIWLLGVDRYPSKDPRTVPHPPPSSPSPLGLRLPGPEAHRDFTINLGA